MKKVLAAAQVLVMLALLGVTAWSLNEAAAQRRAARAAANEATRLQAAYEAAAERADSLEQQLQGGQPAAPQPEPEPETTAGQYTREEADALAAQYKSGVQVGSSIGRIWVEGTGIDCGLYWGDSAAILNLGGGCRDQNGCVLPGEVGTVCIGGHTGSYFHDLDQAQIGAIIHLETPWGDFRYKVTETKVNEETDIAAFRWGDAAASCVLYTCYPIGILEPTPYRYTVYADPVAADGQGPLPFAIGAE